MSARAAIVARLRAVPSWQVTLFGALLALGFLIAAQLQSEAPRVRYTSQERVPLVETARDLQSEQEMLKQQLLDVRDRIAALEQSEQGNAALVTTLNSQLDAARLAAGLVPLRGPGTVIRLEDSDQAVPQGAAASDYKVGARDVRLVVEQLWLAGAEAVAVNGERITATTAFLDIGTSILANSAYLAPPYDVGAIGDAGLYRRLLESPVFSDFIRARAQAVGIRVSHAEVGEVALPAFAGTVSIRHGGPVPSVTPEPSVVPASPAADGSSTSPGARSSASPSPSASRKP